MVCRLGAVTGAGMLLVGTSGVLIGAKAQTAPVTPTNFTVTAVADALSVEVDSGLLGKPFPLVPAGQPADFSSSSSTQAVLDSLGNDKGFASAPYLGSFVNAAPGTVNGVGLPGAQPGIGAIPPLPAIPAIVTTSYPGSETAQQYQGPYGIRSTSDPNGTAADAHIGLVTGGPNVAASSASSVARLDPSTGTMTSQADSSLAAFKIGDLLSLGDVTAHAKLTATPGQKPTKEASMHMGLTILGIPVGLTDKGLIPGAGGIPGLDLSSLNKLLNAAGIDLQFLPGNTTDTSIESAGLAITLNQNLPVQGPVKTIFTFGHVMAFLAPGDVASASTGGGTTGDTGGGGGALNSSNPADTSGGLGSTGTGGATTSPALANGSTGGPLGSVSAAPVIASKGGKPTPGTEPTGTSDRGGSLLPIVGHIGSSVFLALIGAALAVMAAAGLFGGLGVRLLLPSAAAAAGSVLQIPPPS
jgi:hypothetical protein